MTPCVSIKQEEILGLSDMMKEYALQSAKTAIELYLTDGLTIQDYHLAYQIFNEAILYIQRKRGE